jgi:hypothetical protein
MWRQTLRLPDCSIEEAVRNSVSEPAVENLETKGRSRSLVVCGQPVPSLSSIASGNRRRRDIALLNAPRRMHTE